MTDSKKIWYSELQFRFNPADPSQGTMHLGWALEFTTNHYWVVGLALRAALDEQRVAELDDLTRKLLEQRMAVFTREVEQVASLSKALRVGDVIRELAARNPWSFHVAAPRSIALSASEQKASDTSSAEKLTEDYIYKILDVTKREKEAPAEDVDITAQWILPPKAVMMRPLPDKEGIRRGSSPRQ
jgi:hypothetical protein